MAIQKPMLVLLTLAMALCLPAFGFAHHDPRQDCIDAGIIPDFDGDGSDALDCGGDDCDDGDANRYPGNFEVCDLDDHDEDCDATTFGARDTDGDGFLDAECCNQDDRGDYACGNDCDDFMPTTHPISAEVCNDVDDNCDGAIDNGPGVPQFADLDHDGFGDGNSPSEFGVCPGTLGWSINPGDCNDGNPAIKTGDLVCNPLNPTGVFYCGVDGQWSAASCDEGSACVAQLNGAGVCIPEKKTKPDKA